MPRLTILFITFTPAKAYATWPCPLLSVGDSCFPFPTRQLPGFQRRHCLVPWVTLLPVPRCFAGRDAGFGALSDAAVTGRGQRQCHQLEQGVDKTFQGPQRQAEQALEHWRRFDGGIAVLETTARL